MKSMQHGSTGRLVASTLCAALAIPMVASAAPTPGPVPPAANQQLARDVLRELVEIRSVHDVGTQATAAAIAARLLANGFSADEVRVVPEEKYPRQVNVVARLKGRGLGKPAMWICHTDVVEARPEDWSLPPFALTEKDGWFYGRGTLDMKDQCAAIVASLIRLRQEDFVPDRDIIAAFTADEEVGLEQDGINDLLTSHRDLVDAGLVINPDDRSGQLVNGRRQTFDVETSEKTYMTFTLETTAAGGHSSLPRPDNAIYQLAQGLARLQRHQFPFKTNPTTRLYLQRLATFASGRQRADMLAVARTAPDLAAAGRLARDASLNAILHTTCIPTLLTGGHQENALPQRAQATVQCRVMPGETVEQTRAALIGAITDPGVHVTLAAPVVPAPESPPSPEFLGAVERVAHSMWPGVVILPTMAPGASDSIYTRAAGMPSYIVSGTWEDFDDDRRHGRDERREVGVFYESVEFTYRLMKELGNSGR